MINSLKKSLNIKNLFTVVFIFVAFNFIQSPLDSILIHNFFLVIHEAGHFIFAIFGIEWITVLGGTLMQLIVPIIFAIYFLLYQADMYSTSFLMAVFSLSLIDVSIYVADGLKRELPLLGDNIEGHDWYYLLSSINSLHKAEFFGSVILYLGITIFIISVIGMFYFSNKKDYEVIYASKYD